MKLQLLTLICLGAFHQGFAQYRVGLETGIGVTPTTSNMNHSDTHSSGEVTPAFTLSVRRKISRHFFTGVQLFYEGHDFTYDINHTRLSYTGMQYSDGIYVEHKSSYLFVAPLIDVGISRKQVVHFYAAPAIGFKLYGEQLTRTYEFNNLVIQDNTNITSGNISNVIFKLQLGIKQHIKISKQLHMTLNEGMSLMNKDLGLSSKEGTGNIVLAPNYFYFQFGVMRKYRIKAKEAADQK